MRVAAALTAALLVACNGIAGIADLRTGDRDASSGEPGEDAGGDGATNDGATNDGATSGDGAAARDAALPSCGQLVPLRISVDATQTAFHGVVDTNNQISVGAGGTVDFCFPANTSIDLRADPDQSNTSHTWSGASCASPASRCSFPLTAPTTIDVKL